MTSLRLMTDAFAEYGCSDSDARAKLRELIHGIPVAMVSTEGGDGELYSRPLYTQDASFDGELWFATSRASFLVSQLRERARVMVAFSNSANQQYVVVRGLGTVCHDEARIARLWNPAMMHWFPGGPADPYLTLIRIEAQRAEYWDSPSAPTRWLYFVDEAAADTRPHGQHHNSLRAQQNVRYVDA